MSTQDCCKVFISWGNWRRSLIVMSKPLNNMFSPNFTGHYLGTIIRLKSRHQKVSTNRWIITESMASHHLLDKPLACTIPTLSDNCLRSTNYRPSVITNILSRLELSKGLSKTGISDLQLGIGPTVTIVSHYWSHDTTIESSCQLSPVLWGDLIDFWWSRVLGRFNKRDRGYTLDDSDYISRNLFVQSSLYAGAVLYLS